MITQSQYFEIEEYLKKDCRIIEPKLLEELIDHFMDGIEVARQSEDEFIEAFEVVKADFGGKVGVRKIQREWQINALKLHAKGLSHEVCSYFQRPYLWVTLAFCILVPVCVFYFNFRLIGWDRTPIWLGMVSGSLLGGGMIALVHYFQNKANFGSYGLQSRHWFTFVVSLVGTFLICIIGLLVGLITTPVYAQAMAAFFTLTGGLMFISVLRYSNRELYPEYA